MKAKIQYLVVLCVLSSVHGGDEIDQYQPSNYDISRNRQLGPSDEILSLPSSKFCDQHNCSTKTINTKVKRFGLNQFLDYLLGSNYYPGYQPGVGYQPGSGYPGQYPGQYPGHYENPGLAGPPGAHPGCPLCDSSVYSYCSHKQAHDSCCCGGGSYYSCRAIDCKFLYANSCQEFNLISRCCCVDLQKSAAGQVPVVPIAPVA